MRKLSKWLIVTMVVCMVCNYQVISVSASENVKLSVDSVKGQLGSTQDVSVDISNNSAVAGLDIILTYDNTMLEYQDYSKGNVLKKSGFCDVNSDTNTGTIHLVYGALSELSKEGSILNIKFKLLKNINKKYTPQITVNEMIDGSDDMNDLAYTVTTNSEDIQEDINDTSKEEIDSEKNNQSAQIGENGSLSESADHADQTESKNDSAMVGKSDKQLQTDDHESKNINTKSSQSFSKQKLVIAGIIALCFVMILIIFLILKRKKRLR